MRTSRTNKPQEIPEEKMSNELRTADGRQLTQHWLTAVAIAWTGFALTSFAGMAASYASVWYVTEATESPLMLAFVYVCAFLPIGLLSPLAGIVADRFNRKHIVMACDAFLAVSAALMGGLVALGVLSLPLIFAMVTLFGIEQAFRQPAFNAAMPLIVPEKHLMRINMLDTLLSSISMICAPALGIALYTTFGLQAVMFFNAGGAALAAIAMAFATVPTILARRTGEQSTFANLKEGWDTLSSNKGVLILCGGVVVGMMAYGPLDSLIPLMVEQVFGGNGYLASLITAVFGIGMLAGSAILMVRGGTTSLPRIIIGAALVVGTATVVAGLLPSNGFVGFAVAVGFMAIACAGFNGPLMTIIQTHVAPDKLGRVMGLFSAAIGLAIPIGTALGGAVAEGIGVSSFFVVDGIIVLIIAAALGSFRSVRALNDEVGDRGKAAEQEACLNRTVAQSSKAH